MLVLGAHPPRHMEAGIIRYYNISVKSTTILQEASFNVSASGLYRTCAFLPVTDDPNAAKSAALGYTGPTAPNESQLATGQQQRANNIYAEMTFVCPSYWLAEAFSDKGRTSFKYQYSVPLATHEADVSGYFGPAAVTQGLDFEYAFMSRRSFPSSPLIEIRPS